MSRRRSKIAIGGVTVVTAAAIAVGGAWWYALDRPTPAGTVSGRVLPTAQVIRTEVDQRRQVPGALGYGGDLEVLNPGAQGTLTWLPAPGSTVSRGQPLFEVDGLKTRLLLGDRPVWRGFAVGMTDGDDILQLEQNLVALGYGGFTVDRTYTSATACAVRRWQAEIGVPQTGSLPLGSVVFATGPLRAGEQITAAGGRVQPGQSVLHATSSARVVSVALPTSDQSGVAIGNTVYVGLLTGQRLTGKIADMGRVASAASPPAGSTARTGDAGATIPVTIALDPLPDGAQDPTAGLDRAPVQVSISAQRHPDVLAVPVTALVSSTSGGYEVIVVSDGGARRRVVVLPGLLDDITGLIEVTGSGLAAGQQVEVPTS